MAFDMMDGISMLKDPTTGKICLHENYRDGIIDQCTMICLFSIFIAKGIKIMKFYKLNNIIQNSSRIDSLTVSLQ